MKFLHVLFGLVLFLALAAGCAWVVHNAMFVEWWHEALRDLAGRNLLALNGAAALLLLVALYLLTGIRRRAAAEEFVTFESEGGSVSISMTAIRDCIARLREEFAAVLELRPSLRGAGGTLDVELDVRVRSGTQIPELCKLLQDRVRENMKENLGLPDVRSIRVRVREIAPPEAAQKKKAEARGVEHPDWESPIRP
jgi:hypothetical protein